MRIFGREVTVEKRAKTPKKSSRAKNKKIDPSSYNREDFWADISNATSTNREMKIAAVFRCVDILSDNMSMLPWAIVNAKTKDEIDDEYAKQVWYLLNIRPNKKMTPADFFKTLEQHRLRGNAYAEIVRAPTGVPISLEILPPEKVQIIKGDSGDIAYEYSQSSQVRRLNSGQVMHFKNISEDGIEGESVLKYAGESVSGMLSQEKFNRDFYGSGGVLGGILEYDADLAGKQMSVSKDHPHYGKSLKDVMRDEFEKHIRKSSSVVKVAVLDRAGKYKELRPISQRDMAFVESKESSIADIARFYGVPLYKLFTGKESYQSNEQNNIAFVTDKLNPIITKYEQEITYKLLPDYMVRARLQVKANLNVLMRADAAARSAYYEKMERLGSLSPNDIRAKEDMPPIDGGDTYMASLNFVPLKDFEEISKSRNKVND